MGPALSYFKPKYPDFDIASPRLEGIYPDGRPSLEVYVIFGVLPSRDLPSVMKFPNVRSEGMNCALRNKVYRGIYKQL